MSLFSPSNTSKFITHTPLSLERIVQELIGYLKTKPMGHDKVVQDENEDTSVGDDVFKVSELVKPYRVAPSIDLEENLNFYVFDNSLINVDVEELNVVLNSS
jgi:hypothetical protein